MGSAVTAREALDFPAWLACLADRHPRLHAALLAQAQDLELVRLPRGATLLCQGEVAQALYVVAEGLLCASATRADGSELTLSQFGRAEMAGELAILGGSGIHGASVSVLEDAVLVRVGRQAFERIAAQAPEVVSEMTTGIRRRILRDQLAAGLTHLFGELHQDVLRYLEERVEWVRLHAGETLFVHGDTSRDVYFILGGRLRSIAADGRVLSEMGRGESIGEIALLTGDGRTATVQAVRDSDLVRLTPAAFDEVVARYPQVMQAIARLAIQRLRLKERPATSGVPRKCIAVLNLGAGLCAADFCTRLARGLSRVGSVSHLSAARVEELLGQPGITGADREHAAGIRLTAWLDEQEAGTQFLVYETDGTDSAWTQRCLRQADEILLVADAASPPTPRAVESKLLGAGGVSQARQSLVLLHADGSQLPKDTARWFVGRKVQGHFHIRLDGDADFERVARCLAGVAIGVVLGGGGARGLAHIGVVRALREAGVPIDMIGGTSMGAVIAGVLGMGLDWKRILEISRIGWLRYKPHKEYTLPFISIVRSKVLDRWVREVYGTTTIEDLWLNFFCVATNLTTSEVAVFERGSLAQAVRASASLPGLFVPVIADGNVYVDGAVVNNLPGDIMRQRRCKTLIVVDVGSVPTFAFDIAEFPSPWRMLWSQFVPFVKRIDVPNIAALLMRTTEVSSTQNAAAVARDADLCLRPPIDAFGVLEFAKIDQIVDVGFRYAKHRLEQFQRKPTAAGPLPPRDDTA